MGKAEDYDPDEELTLTRGELDALLERRDKRAKMDDDEKRVRSIVRDEMEDALGAFFSFEDSGEGGEGKRKQSPKGTSAEGILGLFSTKAAG